jgi:histidinol dehydrogenase
MTPKPSPLLEGLSDALAFVVGGMAGFGVGRLLGLDIFAPGYGVDAMGGIVLARDEAEAIAFCNDYAPEHLILAVAKEEEVLSQIYNAGSVFIGNFTPEAAGDYASGTNHTLPTYGYARNYSGVSLDSFVKKITYQKITPKGLQALGPAVEIMAENEQLQAHKNAVTLRLNSLKTKKK